MEENQEHSEISKLLQLKQYEQPEEAFFDDFLQDFKARQRTELMQVSARALFIERLMTFFKERNAYQWAGVGALACCVLGLVVFSQSNKQEASSAVSSYQAPKMKPETDAKPQQASQDFATLSEVQIDSPIEELTDVEFVFVDLNQKFLSEDVEF